MTLEYSWIFLKIILASKQHPKVNFGTSKLIFECFKSIFWTSMPPMHQNYSILLDLNPSNASELFHILDLNASKASELFHILGPQCLQCIRTVPYFGPQCLQCIRTIPYYWTSMPPMHQSYWRRRRRRRRRFPKNSGIRAEPCPNVPRNQISRSGNASSRPIGSPKGIEVRDLVDFIEFERENICLAQKGH